MVPPSGSSTEPVAVGAMSALTRRVLRAALIHCCHSRGFWGSRSASNSRSPHAGHRPFAAAATLVEEARTLTEAIGSNFASYGALGLAAWRSDKSRDLPRTEVAGVVDHWASALMYNGCGRYGDALAEAEMASEYPHEFGFATWALVELIEAAARGGRRRRAGDALERLAETTRVSGTEWALGIEA